jgi:hypothetical protein
MRGDGRVTGRGGAAHSAIGIAAFLPAHIETPSQYADRHRATQLQPEKRLMLAVLEDAIDTFRRYRGARDPRARQLARDAADWLSSDAEDWTFDYRRVCEALGLDPDYVRRGLTAWEARLPLEAAPRGYDPALVARAQAAVRALSAAGWAIRRIGPALGRSKMAGEYWRSGRHGVREHEVRALEALVARLPREAAAC